jgi:23S rRNA (guanine745-N1)-methyltransferase
VVADVWRSLPVRDGSAAVVLNVFAPRNAGEIARVLASAGTLITVVPGERHLAELAEPLGLLAVDPHKGERVEQSLSPELAEVGSETLEWTMTLDHRAAALLAAMGPSAYHVEGGELAARVAALPDPIAVTASVRLSRWRLA